LIIYRTWEKSQTIGTSRIFSVPCEAPDFFKALVHLIAGPIQFRIDKQRLLAAKTLIFCLRSGNFSRA
jgi:hypothetical protein